ncbi:methyltransferase domain-containing protein [Streptomyces sp. CBMA29]|uniref:methyltransferase domain-containing protein n=1 Tax=Streptomyces sp. CBMA29 TaxID=1896314 RepID=UPI002948B762|nr:methyltransferase domain-containing protein [Streptomyces sp. CBMA29]MBD0738839.1 protein-L-isoaspartate(D-aspartate) O-methyltransferase [Streptomyces sp. CBMA29]
MSGRGGPERVGRRELGRFLREAGALSPEWAGTFEAVDRAGFLPSLMWPFDMETKASVAVDRSREPDAWYGYADSDVPITTQWDDGEHAGPGPGRVPTSSASMPSVVFRMLGDLAVEDGHRVLDIGTGPGINAAYLAHRLGGDNVFTMEVDAGVAAAARSALALAGLRPGVITGDGLEGHRAAAPYDRIIATAGVRTFPRAWLEQTRPGGVVVLPWGTRFGNRDAVARLVVSGDGTAASGFFTRPVEFMKLRAQRLSWPGHAAHVPAEGTAGPGVRRTVSDIPEDEFFPGTWDALEFALGLRIADCLRIVADKRDGMRPVWLYGLSDMSWAVAVFRDGADTDVYQSGGRALWTEAESAYRWWKMNDSPGFERFGLTVTAGGQDVWLDEPRHSIRLIR